jgi:hypothetical protein
MAAFLSGSSQCSRNSESDLGTASVDAIGDAQTICGSGRVATALEAT